MSQKFAVFQTFHDQAVAEAIAEKLDENNIPFRLENNYKGMEPAYTNNALTVDISLLLRPDDFLNAHQLLADAYKNQVESVDKDYYLFDFTDEELIEIVTKPYEWGYLDYQLAKKILKERGKEINPELERVLKKQNLKDLSKPETVPRYVIYVGYFSAILGGLLGLVIGYVVSYYKRTLPDGSKAYAYRQQDRDQGTIMIIVSLVSIVCWVTARKYF